MDETEAANLSTPLEVNENDELACMGEMFNELFNRIESLVKAQREFVHDISHELRTPITVIRCHTELIVLARSEGQSF